MVKGLDVFRERFAIPGSLKDEMHSFIEAAESDGSINLKSLGIRGTSVSEVCSRLREVYGID